MAQSEAPKAGANGSARSRCIALVGPYLSGKTTLLEAILARTGAILRPGSEEKIITTLQEHDYQLDSIKDSKDLIGLTKTLKPGESDTIE